MQKHLRMMLGVAVVALTLLNGCSKTVSLTAKDVSDYVWLPEAGMQEAAGFYLHPDGRMISLAQSPYEGVFWEVVDNELILKGKPPVDVVNFIARFQPHLSTEELSIVSPKGDSGVLYQRHGKEAIHGDVQYFPLMLMETDIDGAGEVNQRPYLQFDLGDGFVRGFGGVNNFRGSVEVTDISGISFGPIMATRMAGPGMDVEIKLFQCLDLADNFLAVRNDLYFYQGPRLLCRFSLE